MDPEEQIETTESSRSLKREEQIAVWVSVGVVFFSLLITTMLGTVLGSDDEVAEEIPPAVMEQQAEVEEADEAVSCAFRPSGLVCWALSRHWFSA